MDTWLYSVVWLTRKLVTLVARVQIPIQSLMTSDEFNALSNKEKLAYIYPAGADIAELDEIAERLDTLYEANDDEERIQLVQFLNDEDRARGCKWCGG